MEAEITTGKAAEQNPVHAEENRAAQAYLSMLWGALAFASMGALGHLAGERCSWQLVALARASLALVFSLIFALASGVRLVLFKPATLWIRSLSGSIGILLVIAPTVWLLLHSPLRRRAEIDSST
ncbi:MAG TPA: hypothetical protein VF791_12965 [Pyrinomonadaceae bacterium]